MPHMLLIADDEPSLRQLLRMADQDGRFTVVGEAGDGEETLRLVDEHDPDLLLLDLGLPELDGLQVLERLDGRRRPRTVVLTGFDDPATHRFAPELGAVECLIKGRDFNRILERLATVAALKS